MKEDSEATLSSGECAAVEFARNLIELRGGLSHKHSQDYWRFSTKAELRGQVDTGGEIPTAHQELLHQRARRSIHLLSSGAREME
jgi:hypothetical protein